MEEGGRRRSDNSDGYCQSCVPNSSHMNQKSKNMLQCSRHHCGANIHGRFEEITYQFEGSEQCLQYSDIWGVNQSEYQSCTEDEPVVEKAVRFEETDSADDYENEIRQELRWLKAKYQMELRALRDKQLGLAPEKHTKQKMLRQHKDDHDDHQHLLKSFAVGTNFVSFSPNDGEAETCENTSTAKKLCTGDLIPQALNREASLPIDPIDS